MYVGVNVDVGVDVGVGEACQRIAVLFVVASVSMIASGHIHFLEKN